MTWFTKRRLVREHVEPVPAQQLRTGALAVWAQRALGLLNDADADADGITNRAFEELLEAKGTLGLFSEPFRIGWPVAMDATLIAGRLDEADRLLSLFDDRPKQAIPPYLKAQRARYQAIVDAAKGSSDGVEDKLRDAIERFTQLQYPYWRAKAELDLGRWLLQTGRSQDASGPLERASGTFSRLGARPALERAEALLAPLSRQGTA